MVGKGSRFAFSYIPMGRDGRPFVWRWTGLMLWLQKAVEELWLWSIRPEGLASFLGKLSWREKAGYTQGGKRHGVEYFAIAERCSNQH